MNTEDLLASGQIRSKLITFYIFLTIDMVCNMLVIHYDMTGNQIQEGSLNSHNKGTGVILAMAGTGLQLVIQFCMIFWFFFLVWKTFMFKFGLLGKLLTREFPVLIAALINFGFFLVERILRLRYSVLDEVDDVITLYENPVYQIVFWIRNIFSILVFAAGMKSAVQVGSPSYYIPQKADLEH